MNVRYVSAAARSLPGLVLGLVLGLAALAPLAARAQSCEELGGITIGNDCEDYTYEGCCDANVLYWCQAPSLCMLNCGSQQPPLQCGWSVQGGYYWCGDAALPAPNNNPPMECPEPTVTDADGDGYDAESEGGDDCDDGNAAVHPGATEICDNGIDDDCDTYVDTNDADCAQADDDDDMADDDDTADDDGDRNFTETPELGIVCGCRHAAAPAMPWSLTLVVLGLATVLRRR